MTMNPVVLNVACDPSHTHFAPQDYGIPHRLRFPARITPLGRRRARSPSSNSRHSSLRRARSQRQAEEPGKLGQSAVRIRPEPGNLTNGADAWDARLEGASQTGGCGPLYSLSSGWADKLQPRQRKRRDIPMSFPRSSRLPACKEGLCLVRPNTRCLPQPRRGTRPDRASEMANRRTLPFPSPLPYDPLSVVAPRIHGGCPGNTVGLVCNP